MGAAFLRWAAGRVIRAWVAALPKWKSGMPKWKGGVRMRAGVFAVRRLSVPRCGDLPGKLVPRQHATHLPFGTPLILQTYGGIFTTNSFSTPLFKFPHKFAFFRVLPEADGGRRKPVHPKQEIQGLCTFSAWRGQIFRIPGLTPRS